MMMSDENRPKAIQILQILGGCLFVAAYFLPGISFPAESHGLIGYKCAREAMTFGVTGIWDVIRGKEPWKEIWIPLLVGVSSLNNFLVPIHVLMRKRSLVVAVVVSCVATPCAVFFAVNERPLIGYYLWILGALLILLPEAIVRSDVATIAEP